MERPFKTDFRIQITLRIVNARDIVLSCPEISFVTQVGTIPDDLNGPKIGSACLAILNRVLAQRKTNTEALEASKTKPVKLLKINEVAKLLGVSQGTVRNLEIEYIVTPGGHRRYELSKVMAFKTEIV